MDLNLLFNKDQQGNWIPPAFSPEIVNWYGQFFVSPWLLELHINGDKFVPTCCSYDDGTSCPRLSTWWTLVTARVSKCCLHVLPADRLSIKRRWYRDVYTTKLIVLGQLGDIHSENLEVTEFSKAYTEYRKSKLSQVPK